MAPDDTVQSRLLFEEARQRMAEERYETACALFERSLQLHAGIGTTYNLAQCLEKTGQTASAWKLYRSVAKKSAERGQKARESVALREAARIESQLAHLVVRIASPVAGLAVTLQGEPLSQANWGQLIPLDPNTYRIEAQSPGYSPWVGMAKIEAAGATITVEVPQLRRLNPSTAKAPEPLSDSLDPKTRWYRSPVIWLGAGAASLVGSGLFLRSANVSMNRQQNLCEDPNSACPPGEVTEYNHWAGQARGALTKSYVLAGLSALSVGAGVWLWSSNDSQPSNVDKTSPRAWVTVDGLALRANLRF